MLFMLLFCLHNLFFTFKNRLRKMSKKLPKLLPQMSNSNYAKRMDRLSRRIFGEVVRPTDQRSMKIVQVFSEFPVEQESAPFDIIPSSDGALSDKTAQNARAVQRRAYGFCGRNGKTESPQGKRSAENRRRQKSEDEKGRKRIKSSLQKNEVCSQYT